ncbi:RNA-directed DNA polymerase, eukaryota [Tanacetum coccineum]|uniref:RNA-directed DNA polymerase, eukaryota n=1 Tax=Tanacetum coccineum TaxID=301880 RepID=A0ABQ5EKJ8_9ASTR
MAEPPWIDDLVSQFGNSLLLDSNVLDQGGVTDDILLSRLEVLKQLHDVQSSNNRDIMQKAKIRWAIEGDENSKYFHAIINKKRANLSVKGIMVDGDWIVEPDLVKQEFRRHFTDRFQDPGSRRGSLNFPFPNRLNNDQILELESPISNEDIRTAVWGCGVDKSPGPDVFLLDATLRWRLIPKVLDPKVVSDYRPISLIGSLYKVVTKILASRLSLVISDLISDVQTAFLPNRQILDVDFASAMILYNGISDDVLISFGFGPKWRSWIRGSLSSGKASILVNGSPTTEFHLYRGLKQGDPLAPFLFLLIMESLHLSFSRAVEAGIFKGYKIDPSTTLSHLFYADYAYVLKSHLLGVGIPDNCVAEAAKSIGCLIMKAPFKYLERLLVNWSKVLASKKSEGWESLFLRSQSGLFSEWEVNSLKVKGVDLISHCKIRVGKDISVADKMNTSISSSFRRHVRGGVESQQLDQLSLLLDTVILSNMDDRWFWDLNGDGVFQVKDVRSMLDEAFLPKMEVPTRWIKSIPIKVNVFAWKLYLDRLPTRSNLSHRNVSLPSLACPLCDHVLEDSSHLFFGCSVAKDIQKLICRWWNLDVHPYDSYEDWLSWFKYIRLGSKTKEVLEGVFYVSWWSLWNFRNQFFFASPIPRKDAIFDNIVLRSFYSRLSSLFTLTLCGICLMTMFSHIRHNGYVTNMESSLNIIAQQGSFPDLATVIDRCGIGGAQQGFVLGLLVTPYGHYFMCSSSAIGCKKSVVIKQDGHLMNGTTVPPTRELHQLPVWSKAAKQAFSSNSRLFSRVLYKVRTPANGQANAFALKRLIQDLRDLIDTNWNMDTGESIAVTTRAIAHYYSYKPLPK